MNLPKCGSVWFFAHFLPTQKHASMSSARECPQSMARTQSQILIGASCTLVQKKYVHILTNVFTHKLQWNKPYIAKRKYTSSPLKGRNYIRFFVDFPIDISPPPPKKKLRTPGQKKLSAFSELLISISNPSFRCDWSGVDKGLPVLSMEKLNGTYGTLPRDPRGDP